LSDEGIMSRRPAWAFALLLETFAVVSGGLAVAAEIPDDKDQVIQKLLDRVDALEREVAALQLGRIQQKPGQQASTPPAAPTQAVVTEQEPAPSDDATAPNPTQPETSSRFNFHGYADAGFQRNVDGTHTKKFDLGEIDLFGTERLSPHLTALMELVFETDDQQLVASVPVNVERLLLQYRGNDFFNVDIGSYRTAIGYYSTAYLRGAWLQTAISRPRVFTFEDQGGFLPLHAVGVSVNGRIPSGDLNLHYVAEVGSSRNYGNIAGLSLEPSFNRATNLAVFSQPRGVPGLEIGFSTYHDLFSPAAGFQLDRSVWTVHFVYVRGRVEFLNEGMRIGLLDLSAPGAATGLAFYSQFAYRVASSWKPYGRVEYLNAHGTGVIDTAIAREYIPWKTVYTGGVRHDLTDSVALKFELARETDYMRSSYISAAVQLAFAF
jgi:hypothetical protein